MRIALARLNVLLIAAWLGAMLFMGAAVAPALFAFLPTKQMAGDLAGHLFAYVDWLGIGLSIWLGMYGLIGRHRIRLAWFAIAGLLLANRFVLVPMMVAIKALGPLQSLPENSPLLWRFGILHGVSSLIYWSIVLSLIWQAWRGVARLTPRTRLDGSRGED